MNAVQLRMLVTLLRLGQTLPEALEILAETEPPRQSQRLRAWAEELRRGGQVPELSAGLRDLPNFLLEKATLEEERAKRKQLAVAIYLYPLCLLGLALAFFYLLSGFVLNEYSHFVQTSAELPFLTRVAFALSLRVRNPIVLLIGTGCLVPILFALANPQVLLRLPILGDWLTRKESAGFLRWLAAGLQAGLSLPEATAEAARASAWEPFRDQLSWAARELEQGKSLALALEGCSLFPATSLWIVQRAEQLELTHEYLRTAARTLDEEEESLFEFVLHLLEPLVYLGVAGLLGFAIIALFQPLYQLFGGPV